MPKSWVICHFFTFCNQWVGVFFYLLIQLFRFSEGLSELLYEPWSLFTYFNDRSLEICFYDFISILMQWFWKVYTLLLNWLLSFKKKINHDKQFQIICYTLHNLTEKQIITNKVCTLSYQNVTSWLCNICCLYLTKLLQISHIERTCFAHRLFKWATTVSLLDLVQDTVAKL